MTSRTPHDIDASAFRRLLDRAADVAAGYWDELPSRRAFTRPPDDLVARLRAEPLPRSGRPPEEIIDRIAAEVATNPLGVGHPRWWGFVSASAHPVGIAADMIAATLNNHVIATSQLAIHIELKVLEWLAEIVGLPAGSGGILVSGGSMANFVALAAAREARVPGTRARGLLAHGRPLAMYASAETHSCIPKAVDLLGIGRDSLRLIPVDERLRMDVRALRERIRADRAADVQPLVIVASAGTVNTGAIDPMDAIADVAAEEDCWLHVDGAYGGFAGALPELADAYRGIERADSVAADPHKWLYIPYEAGAVLVRDPATLHAAFSARPAYLAVEDDSYLGGALWFYDRGPQLSRGFRALKIWATLQAVGLDGYRELWRNDMAVAREVERLAAAHPKLAVMAETELSSFCIRYLPECGDADMFNRTLLDRTHRDGRVLLTPVELNGAYGLRGCVVNFRSTLEDARICVDAVVELGTQLEQELRETQECCMAGRHP